MNQRVTIVKVAGRSGTAILQLFERWTKSRTPSPVEPGLVEPNQWPPHSRQQMTRLADAVRQHSTEPPIVFYAEYVDMWSMGDVYRRGFPEDAESLYEVEADDGLCLWCYSLPDDGALERHLKRQLRRKHFADETRWFLQCLQHASRAWDTVVTQSCILVIREVVGRLVEDGEIAASAESVPEWLERLQD